MKEVVVLGAFTNHRTMRFLRRLVPTAVSFRRLHVSYFLVLSSLGSLLLIPLLPFTDAVFNAVSALSLTGLCSVEMHRFSLPYLTLLLLLMLLGSHGFTSAIPLFIRHSASRRRSNFHPSAAATPIIPPPSPSPPPPSAASPIPSECPPRTISRMRRSIRRAQSMPALPNYTRTLYDSVAGSARRLIHWSLLVPPFPTLTETSSLEGKLPPCHHQHDVESPPAMAVDADQSARLEQDALALLIWIVPAFLALSIAVGFAASAISVLASSSARSLLHERRVNVAFFALFTTVSAIGNVGLLPLDDNMMELRGDAALLLSTTVLMLVGNTLYAPAMRGVVWLLHRATSGRVSRGGRGGGQWKRAEEALEYMLRSPRRCFTHLYPKAETVWLVGTVVVLNGVQTAALCGMDWTQLGGGAPAAEKLVVALFTSVANRNGGMNAVNIAAFSTATLLLSALMM